MPPLQGTTITAIKSDADPQVTIRLNGELGNLVTGGNGSDGNMMVFDGAGTGNTLHDPSKANIHLDGKSATLRIGGNTKAGSISVLGSAPFSVSTIEIGGGNGAQLKMSPEGSSATSVHIDGQNASLRVNSVVTPPNNTLKSATVSLVDTFSTSRIELDSESGGITMRGRNENDGQKTGGRLKMLDGSGNEQIHLDSNTGNITLTGDIFLTGADCAEEFSVQDGKEPGTVVVIGHGETLAPSREAYDRKVAGVISGGGAYKPAIILNHDGGSKERCAVALVGRTYCKVDARYCAIEIGDLLTTSETPGHAMKATDRQRAFGAVIGKALQPLQEGQGLIPILIAMQ